METLARSVASKKYADGKMLSAKDDGVGLITFNNPEKRNAMSIAMWEGLGQILEEFRDDHSVRVVVLSGAGSKGFAAGAEIAELDAMRANAEAQREYERLTSAGRERLAAFPKPTIARIRGACLGGGLGIAMQADLRIAALDSQFGIPMVRLGIGYGFDMVRRLVALVGDGQARMLLFTGSRIDATEAQRIGLVNRAVPDEDLSDVVVDLARTIADNAPLSLAVSKLSVEHALKDPEERDLEAIRRGIAACYDSADYREGRAAFLAKRSPRFQGR